MSQKTKKLLHNLEKYLAILLIIGGLAYLYPHLNESQISTKSGVAFCIIEIGILEAWAWVKELSEKHKTK